jgi:DDB1- and CUL4-associated factor 7
MSSNPTNNSQTKRKEIYKYEAPWIVYAMNWSIRPDKRFRLALGSFVEEYNNKVRVNPLLSVFHVNQKCGYSSFRVCFASKVQIVSLDEETSEFIARSTFDHPYPTTKVMWIPDTVNNQWHIINKSFYL